MSWADDKLAAPMGFQYAVLFPRARDAIASWHRVTGLFLNLPSNVCRVLAPFASLEIPVDDETGLAPVPVQLYGYRQEIGGELEIDPLMTGWGRKPCCDSSIVSFGDKKFVRLGHGGALLTNDLAIAEGELDGHWPFDEDNEATRLLIIMLDMFQRTRMARQEQIAKWDAALGDLLPRIPLEQVIPWRVMRRVPFCRDGVVKALREAGIPVGTNYPPLSGSNKWGDEVINFFPEDENIEETVRIIREVLYD